MTAPADGVISHRKASHRRHGGTGHAGSDVPHDREAARSSSMPRYRKPTWPGSPSARRPASPFPGSGEVAGSVRLVAPAVDRSTRLGLVRILLEKDANLRIGTFARGEIEVARGTGLAVPRSAVLFGKSGPSVQVVENDTIATRAVTIGLSEAELDRDQIRRRRKRARRRQVGHLFAQRRSGQPRRSSRAPSPREPSHELQHLGLVDPQSGPAARPLRGADGARRHRLHPVADHALSRTSTCRSSRSASTSRARHRAN